MASPQNSTQQGHCGGVPESQREGVNSRLDHFIRAVTRPLCSRLLVTSPARSSASNSSIHLRKMRCSCSFRALICADLHAKRAQFAALKKVMCFVFRYFLASFPLFFICCSSLISPSAGLLRFSSQSEACPRQCVLKTTTIIGYHRPRGLSSRKCERTGSAGILPALRFVTLAGSTASLALRGCQNAARGCTLSDFRVPKKATPIEGTRFQEEELL